MKSIFIIISLILLISLGSSAQIPAYLPTYGLMAWFPFTGNAIDSTGHGHDGTVFGATMASGRYGTPNSAYNFDGISNYIYIPAGSTDPEISVDITASLTIAAWVKSNNYFYTSQEQIYWRGNSLSAHDPHMLYLNGGEVRIRRDIDPGTTVTEVGTTLSGLDTNFHLFVGTYDSASGNMCVYVDGILKNKQYLPGLETYPTSTMYNYIGAVDGGTWQFFYGIIDELALWRRALTPCEVAALYYSLPDIITAPPSNDTVSGGGTAIFNVSVAVTSPSYQWQENSGAGFVNLSNIPPYSGVNTAHLTISPVASSFSGNTYRCVLATDSCVDHATESGRLIVVPTNIKHLQNDNSILLIPNPTNGNFTIQSSGIYATIDVEITNALGQIIDKEKVYPAKNGCIDHQIMFSDKAANGTYFLHLTSEAENDVFKIVLKR